MFNKIFLIIVVIITLIIIGITSWMGLKLFKSASDEKTKSNNRKKSKARNPNFRQKK